MELGEPPAVLMLGKGWFPAQLGGLDRYFRDLFESLPEARGLIVGPAEGSPARLVTASSHDAPLPARLFAMWMASRIAGRDARVVDAHFALYALPTMLSRRLRSLPLIVHFHGPWADENVAAGQRSRGLRVVRRCVERGVYRRADQAIVLTSAFRRVLVEEYRVSPWRVHVQPPGVDLERFSPGDRARARRRFDLDDGVFVAVAVRRLVPRMGLDVLLDAWARARVDMPAGSQLLIAGDGTQRADLERRLRRLRLSESVRLLGRLPDEALIDLYRAADLGIVPSRSFEGFGLVVIEAAACGTPTIVTEVGGLPEAVDALDSSLVVPPNDVDALARRVAAASTESGRPSRTTTREFAERFSWEAAVRRNRAVVRDAITPQPRRRRIRVVYLDHVAELSGGEIALLRLIPHLDEVEPHVILAEDGPLATRLVQAGISTEVLGMRERARGLRKANVSGRRMPFGAIASTASYVVRLAIRLRRLRPDLVHTNSLKSGLYGSVAARLAGVPVVWHVRDRIADDYLPPAAVRMVRLMTRCLPNAVIANSRATLSTLDPRTKAVVIHSVLPDAPVASDRKRRDPADIVVGMVGRLAPWKGQDLFLRAFADAFPSGHERCMLVGSSMFGEEDFVGSLKALVAELGLTGRVEFRGFQSDIWPELALMDILVHASLTPEPFGQVILEGMAAGVPVVAADAGGPAEIVHHGVDGLLYPIGNQTALAAALRQLAHDPELASRLAIAGGATAAEYYPGKVVGRLQAVYRDVTDRAAPRSRPRSETSPLS
jgi:glycosyltransferase involved in cell wall biosynthesis